MILSCICDTSKSLERHDFYNKVRKRVKFIQKTPHLLLIVSAVARINPLLIPKVKQDS